MFNFYYYSYINIAVKFNIVYILKYIIILKILVFILLFLIK